VFIERKIMGRLQGQAMYDTEAILGYMVYIFVYVNDDNGIGLD